ncbi:MAG: response regulator [Deltaproteobacteria bacterium]|nr:MAG: response regulator [Deltaproteobacteria bacterium]
MAPLLAFTEGTVSDLNILMVDDDVVDVLDVERALRRRGISNPLRVARDGVEALDMLLGRDGYTPIPAPRIILLDLNMPRMDGFEFLRALRAHPEHEDDLVFVLTTSDDDRHRAQAHELGIAGYIVKDDLPLRALDLVLQGLQAIPPAELSLLEVGDLLRHTWAELDPGDGFELLLPASVLLLETAGERLRLVFRHLVENAIEHHDKERGRVKVDWEEIDDVVHFRVIDDGPGIPPESERDVLRPLHTTKGDPTEVPVAGRGMGLTIVQHVVASAGGSLDVRGSEGRGTTVSFTWPMTWRDLAEVPLVAVSGLEGEDAAGAEEAVDPTDLPEGPVALPPPNFSRFPGWPGEDGPLPDGATLPPGAIAPVDGDDPGRPATGGGAARTPPAEERELPYTVVLAVRDELDRVGIRRAMMRRGFGPSLRVAAGIDAALDQLRALRSGAPPGAVRLVADHRYLSARGGDLVDLLRADADLRDTPTVLLVSPDEDADLVAGQVAGIAGVVVRRPPAYEELLDLLAAWR